ncbi:MAG: hypothetical protein MK404_07795 [SAR324 cluster bacterium]|nr:hypothetical protein [SAR324 cluster bacterium]
MLNRTKYFRKLCLSGSFLVGLISLSSTANAQFIGINVDYGIGYSAAPGKVDGYSVGISHPAPFIPNIGYSSISFIDKESITDPSDSTSSVSLDTKITINTINLFYNVPFPVVTITLGFGGGSQNLRTGVDTKTTIVENNKAEDQSDLKTSLIEAFFHIGLPFWNTIEFHLGYHYMSFSSIDRTSKKIEGTYTNDNKRNYTGGMTTIGVQVAF